MQPNKKLKRTRVFAFATMLLATTALNLRAQMWSSPELILPGPDPADPQSAPTGSGYAVLINPFNSAPAPGVFVGLNTYNAGTASIMRLTPIDSASTFFTQDDIDNPLTLARGLAYNPNDGSLYAAGNGPVDPKARNVTYIWKVIRSTAPGDAEMWDVDDAFSLSKSASSTAHKIAIDSDGRAFVSGIARDGKGPYWVVRRKELEGSWETVFKTRNNNNNMVTSVCFFPGKDSIPPAMFTVSDLNSKWTVMRSRSQGASGTWEQVDSWRPSGATAASAYGIACDPARGKLYVVGCRGLNGVSPSNWVIRMSPDGGDHWTPLLDEGGAGSWASEAAIDSDGTVSVSGVIKGTTPLWKVIRCTDPENPASWAASFADPDPTVTPFGADTYSKGGGIAADAFGNVFVTGLVRDWIDDSTLPSTTYAGDRVGLLRLVP